MGQTSLEQALKERAAMDHWGAREGILRRGPSIGTGSEARVQCVSVVARKRLHGLRCMEEMRLKLISLALFRASMLSFRLLAVCQHKPGHSPRLPSRERESELVGISTDHFFTLL